MPSIKVRGLMPPSDHGHTAVGDGGALGSEVVDTDQIAAGAVTDAEVAAGANISKDKLGAAARTALYHGDEVEVSVTGTSEDQVKDLAIIKDAANALEIKTLKIVARMKTSNAAAQASLNVYHDGGGAPDLTLTSTVIAYEEKSGTIDTSGWATGRHTIEVKLVSATPGETAYNELLELYAIQ